jgi:hypothetical protein
MVHNTGIYVIFPNMYDEWDFYLDGNLTQLII